MSKEDKVRVAKDLKERYDHNKIMLDHAAAVAKKSKEPPTRQDASILDLVGKTIKGISAAEDLSSVFITLTDGTTYEWSVDGYDWDAFFEKVLNE